MLAHVPDRRGLPFEELLPIADELMDIIPPSKLRVRADSDLRKLIEANRWALIFYILVSFVQFGNI